MPILQLEGRREGARGGGRCGKASGRWLSFFGSGPRKTRLSDFQAGRARRPSDEGRREGTLWESLAVAAAACGGARDGGAKDRRLEGRVSFGTRSCGEEVYAYIEIRSTYRPIPYTVYYERLADAIRLRGKWRCVCSES